MIDNLDGYNFATILISKASVFFTRGKGVKTLKNFFRN